MTVHGSADVTKRPIFLLGLIDSIHLFCMNSILGLSSFGKKNKHGLLLAAMGRAEIRGSCHAGDAPSFALTEEEKQYKGEAEDRKALMAHLRWVTEREQQLQQQKDAWQAKQRSSRAGKASPATAVGKVG